MECNRCHTDTDQFYKGQRCCKTCSKQKNAIAIAKDPTRRKENVLRHYRNNKDKYAAYRKQYKVQNKAKIKAYDRLRLARPQVKLQEAANEQRRRERVLATKTTFSKTDYQLVYSRFSNQCFKCGKVDRLCVDHHYPLAKGYKLEHTNAVLLCKSCNSSKRDRLPEEFYSSEELKKLKTIFANTVEV